jgi:rod shape-determining protein MreC
METGALCLIVKSSTFKETVVAEKVESLKGNVYSAMTGIQNYLYLKKYNSMLIENNMELISENISLHCLIDRRDNDSLDSSTHRYEYIPARIVENTLNRKHNRLMLDAGKKQGADKDMGVISADGVVGIIDRAGDNFCTVVSLLNPDKEISAKLKRSGMYGPLVWDGQSINYTELVDIPPHADVVTGDSIVTSGHSLTFPEGIFIGTVDTFHIDKGTSIKIRVKLNNNFKSLHSVYIIKDFLKPEFDSIKTTYFDNRKKT